jgi:hypothetical protein
MTATPFQRRGCEWVGAIPVPLPCTCMGCHGVSWGVMGCPIPFANYEAARYAES